MQYKYYIQQISWIIHVYQLDIGILIRQWSSLYMLKIDFWELKIYIHSGTLSLDWSEWAVRINIYFNTFHFFLKCLQLLERVTYGCKITTPSGYIEELIRYLVTHMWVRSGDSYIVHVHVVMTLSIYYVLYGWLCIVGEQDELNPTLWLATQVSKIVPSCPARK